MKLVSLIAASASLTALLILPARLEVAGTVVLAAGFAALLHHDDRARRALRLPRGAARRWRPAFRAPALRSQIEPHRLAA